MFEKLVNLFFGMRKNKKKKQQQQKEEILPILQMSTAPAMNWRRP
jgi:hypothetical protein